MDRGAVPALRRRPFAPTLGAWDVEGPRTALRRMAATAALAAALAAPSPARAGNEESLFFGDEATLSAGALLAHTTEAGAAWYNPAGLAPIRRHRVSLSGTAFSVRVRPLPGALVLRLREGAQAADLGTVEFRVIPSGIAIARNLYGVATVAFCMFISERDSLYGRATARGTAETVEGEAALLAHATTWRQDDTYNIGAAVGWEATPTLHLGAAAFLVVEVHRGRSRVLGQEDHGASDLPAQMVTLEDGERSGTVIGGFARFGFQWRAAEGFSIAATARTPTAALATVDDRSALRIGASSGVLFGDEVGSRFAEAESPNAAFKLVTPAELRVGLAWSGPWGWVGLEGSFRPAHRDPARGIDDQLLWNARIGGIFALTRALGLGAGLFTDNSTLARPAGLLAPAVEYYGATFGIRIASAHRVDDDPRPDRLVFTTTLALRYALGAGRAATAVVDPFASSSGWALTGEMDVLFHEVSLLLGSSILF